VERTVVIGNAGGGKSTLARKLAARRRLPHIEIDALLWRPGWQLTPSEIYDAEHTRAIAQARWVIDGLGRRESIAARLSRATAIALVDLPLWVHFWLAAERQIAWSAGRLADPPASAPEMPPTEDLFRTIWEVDRDWMPEIRRLVAEEERRSKRVFRLTTIKELSRFSEDK
jgi:adenylate kinase family enzyme